MAIKEKWMGSPHYRAGRSQGLTHGVLHTTEGAQTVEALGAWFANPSSGVSSHHGADNIKRGLFGAYVLESNTAWTQGNANGFCVSIELCTPVGASGNWSRSYWLDKYDTLLWNAAEWVRYIADKYKLPMVALSNTQAQTASAKGFCQHKNLGSMGSGHVDCGNMPMDVVLQRAQSFGTVKPPATGGSNMPSLSAVAMYKGGAYHAAIGTNGQVYFKTPTGAWTSVDAKSNAKSGVDLSVDDNGLFIITYVSQLNHVCTYQKFLPDPPPWTWTDRGFTAGLQPPSVNTPVTPPAAFKTLTGVDYSYDRPNLSCLKAQGVTFVMRYGSRTPSKNLTREELTAIRANALKIGVFWQEGKTQMLRGAAGGTADAKEADAFFKSLGLLNMPIVFACDFDPTASQWASIDAYMNAVKAYLGLARTGGYGGYEFVKRQFDAGRMKYAVQTYAWSSAKWDARAQLRQVKNDQLVCGGKIDWEEQRAADAPLRT